MHGEWRRCVCGQAAARYARDGRNAQIWGSVVVIGVDTGEYEGLLGRKGKNITGFSMPEDNHRIMRVRDV